MAKNPDPAPQLEFSLGDPSGKRPKGEPKLKGYLINPARVRQFALDMAKRDRHHTFTAVSVEFIQRIDAKLRNLVQDEIRRHPSKGSG